MRGQEDGTAPVVGLRHQPVVYSSQRRTAKGRKTKKKSGRAVKTEGWPWPVADSPPPTGEFLRAGTSAPSPGDETAAAGRCEGKMTEPTPCPTRDPASQANEEDRPDRTEPVAPHQAVSGSGSGADEEGGLQSNSEAAADTARADVQDGPAQEEGLEQDAQGEVLDPGVESGPGADGTASEPENAAVETEEPMAGPGERSDTRHSEETLAGEAVAEDSGGGEDGADGGDGVESVQESIMVEAEAEEQQPSVLEKETEDGVESVQQLEAVEAEAEEQQPSVLVEKETEAEVESVQEPAMTDAKVDARDEDADKTAAEQKCDAVVPLPCPEAAGEDEAASGADAAESKAEVRIAPSGLEEEMEAVPGSEQDDADGGAGRVSTAGSQVGAPLQEADEAAATPSEAATGETEMPPPEADTVAGADEDGQSGAGAAAQEETGATPEAATADGAEEAGQLDTEEATPEAATADGADEAGQLDAEAVAQEVIEATPKTETAGAEDAGRSDAEATAQAETEAAPEPASQAHSAAGSPTQTAEPKDAHPPPVGAQDAEPAPQMGASSPAAPSDRSTAAGPTPARRRSRDKDRDPSRRHRTRRHTGDVPERRSGRRPRPAPGAPETPPATTPSSPRHRRRRKSSRRHGPAPDPSPVRPSSSRGSRRRSSAASAPPRSERRKRRPATKGSRLGAFLQRLFSSSRRP